MRFRMPSNSVNPTDACQSAFPGLGSEVGAGVRPSSGAAGIAPPSTPERPETILFSEVAAPEDGRTPAVRQECAGRSTCSAPSYKPNQSNGNPPLSLTVSAGSKAGAASYEMNPAA